MTKEERKEYNKKYSQSPKGKKAQRKYRQSAKGKEYRRKYKQSPNGKRTNKKYSQTPKGKIARIQSNAKRRQLGFIPLNVWFEGSEGHHIDGERVIYIPKVLHRSVWHSINLGINMDKINRLAFNYLQLEIEADAQYYNQEVDKKNSTLRKNK